MDSYRERDLSLTRREFLGRVAMGVGATVLCLPTKAGFTQHDQQAAYHVESALTKRVRATLTARVTYVAANPAGLQWSIFGPYAPELDRQSGTESSLKVVEFPDARVSLVSDQSPLKRPFLQIKTTQGDPRFAQGITVTAKHEATLFARKLVRGVPRVRLSPLSTEERQAYLASTASVDHATKSFQQWLDENSLRRKPQESDLFFAFRAFKCVRETVRPTGGEGSDVRASTICRLKGSGCGQIAILFCAILRANGIPARSLWGRWAQTATEPSQFFMWHVKAEFYTEGIGWVPVDPGAGGAKTFAPLVFFGVDGGDFITFHVDPDLVLDSGLFGSKSLVGVQGVLPWWMGGGRLDNWKISDEWVVENLPLRAPAEGAGR